MTSRVPRIGAIALVAALAVPLGATTVHAEVVFGNLGATGTGNLGGVVTDFGNNPPNTDATQRLAVGFTTGASVNFLTLQSVTLGLFGATPPSSVNISVGIYADDSGKPASTPLFTSGALAIGDTAKYTFSFGASQLSASTTYWIVPEPETIGSWVNNFANTAPIARNDSGYAAAGALRYGIFDEEDPTLGWYAAPTSGMSASVTAVPEPSTYALAATALGLCGIAAARRRRTGC